MTEGQRATPSLDEFVDELPDGFSILDVSTYDRGRTPRREVVVMAPLDTRLARLSVNAADRIFDIVVEENLPYAELRPVFDAAQRFGVRVQ